MINIKDFFNKEWKLKENQYNEGQWQCEKAAYNILPKFFGIKKQKDVPKNWNIISGKKIFKNIKINLDIIKILLDLNKKIIISHHLPKKINEKYENNFDKKKDDYQYWYPGHTFTLLKMNNKLYIIQSFVNKYKFNITEIKNLKQFVNDMEYMNKQKKFTKKYDQLYKKYFNSNLDSFNFNKSLINKPTFNTQFLIDSYY